jgi:nucleotide-binding universal stress UspA family protein
LTGPEEADRYLAGIAADLLSVDIVADYHVHANPQDDVTASIAAHVQELGASLVVLCTHGHGGPRGWIIGSVAQRVVRQAAVPILLIRPSDEAAVPFAPRSVVTALDGTSEGESVLPAALTLARAFDAVLRLVLIVPTVSTVSGDRAAAALVAPAATTAALEIEATTAAAYIERVASRLSKAGVVVEGDVLRGDAVRSMSKLAAREAPSLLAMATHARGGFDALWSASVGSRVIGRVSSPLLLVRPAENRSS